MEEEIWKDIQCYENRYQVSNYGRIKSLLYKNEYKILLPRDNGYGYLYVTLYNSIHKSKRHYIHRLVGNAFIPNTENLPEIDHINTIKSDNNVSNLRWVTRQENCNNNLSKLHQSNNHSNIKGLNNPMYGKFGKDNPKAKGVVQLKKDNKEFIKCWDSAKSAGTQLNIPPTNITRCCKNKIKSAGGFIWRYEKDKSALINILNGKDWNEVG